MNKLTALFVVTMILYGCDSSDTAKRTPEQIKAEVEANQKQFAEEKKRIEKENKRRVELLALQRSFVNAAFLSADDKKIVVELTNNTEKDLDNLSGSLEVFDQDGNYVTGIGLTNWVPGYVYLHAGATTTARKGLELLPDNQRKTIVQEAHGYSYYYTTIRYQYAGESEVDLLQAEQPQTAVVPEPIPANRAELTTQTEESMAKPCSADQAVSITREEYYPGPKCEHVSRNLDSERFKLEYIELCQSEIGSESASVASVQIASCVPDQNRGGIVYTKQLCCSSP